MLRSRAPPSVTGVGPPEPPRVPDDPDDPAVDVAIRASLDAATADAWAELRDALAVVDSLDPDGYCKWSPWPEYSPEVDRLRSAVGAAGLVVPYAWPKWAGIERHRGGRGMAEVPVEDAVRMVTAVLRSERFSDGSIDGALRDGTFQAAVRRVLRWAEGC